MIKKEVYQAYIPKLDKTVIFEDVYKGEEIISSTVIGFYFGEPNEEDMKEFTGKLKAEFE